MQTVIDSLIVKLGLDPRDFTKGEKEVAASALATEKVVTKSTENMGASFAGFVTKLVGVVSVVALVKKSLGYLADLSAATRKLGIDARNYGIAADELRDFQNASEMMGGKAEDTTRSIGGLGKALYDLTFNGQMSEQLIMLARLGVQFQDSSGHARKFKDVVLDTADAIEKAQSNGTLNRQEAYFALQQSGFDEGTSQLILSGRKNVEAQLALQEKRRQVSAKDVDAATKIEQARTNVSQDFTAGAQGALTAGAPAAITAINAGDWITRTISGQTSLGDVAKDTADKVRHLGDMVEHLADIAPGVAPRGIRNNNPANIKAVGNQLRDRKGFRVFHSMDEGIRAASEQLDRYSKRGINSIGSIVDTWAPASDGNNTAAYKADLARAVGKGVNDPLDSSDRALLLAGMSRHESGAKAPDVSAIADVLTMQDGSGSALASARGAVPSPHSAASTSHSSTTVNVGPVTINTQAKDASGIASDIDGAVRRKMLSAHAEKGMQ